MPLEVGPLIDLGPLGESAFLARFATESGARDWAGAVRRASWPGIVDVVLAYRSAAVFADPDRVDLDDLEGRLRRLEPIETDAPTGRRIVVPVLYDGEDLAEAADRLGLATEDVVAHHAGCDFDVFAVGFLPGFPYAGYLPAALSGLARRTPPRVRVPAGSVAIVGRQTGIYPSMSPGGWHLIGRTPLRIVDPIRGHFPIRAGDRLRFQAIGLEEFEARRGDLLP